MGCQSLVRVALPPTTAFIGNTAFRDCRSLTDAVLPDSVTTVGIGAFMGCSSLTKLVIPDSVTAIGDYAFRGCSSLSRVTMPDSVSVIGNDAFSECMLLIIECTESSYSHWYATHNNIPFRLISLDDMSAKVRPYHAVHPIDISQVRSNFRAAEQRSPIVRASASTASTAPAAVRSPVLSAVRVPIPEAVPAAAHAPQPETAQAVPAAVRVPIAETVPAARAPQPEAAQAVPTPNEPPSGSRYAYICCADEDYTAVQPLLSKLEADGFRFWRGENAAKSVKTYKTVTTAIKTCSLVLVIHSKNTAHSDRVSEAELDFAIRNRSDDTLVLMMDGTSAPVTLSEAVSENSFLRRDAMSADDFETRLRANLAESGCGREGTHTELSAEDRRSLFTHPEYDYAVTPGGATITRYKGCAAKLEVPAKLFGYGVTENGSRAFIGCTTLTEVTLPSSIAVLGVEDFKDCANLRRISLPASLMKLGYGSFRNCASLAEISLPSSVTEIGWHAFAGCSSLTSIAIPQHVSKIESWAFDGCDSLTKICIPDKVTKIDVNAFFNCSKRLTIYSSKDAYAHTYAQRNGYNWKKSHDGRG